MSKKLAVWLILMLAASLALTAYTPGGSPVAVQAPAALIGSAQTPNNQPLPPQGPKDSLTLTADDIKIAEDFAKGVAETIGLTQYGWEVWALPAETTWDDVYQYYNQQATEAGWASDVGTEQDFEGGKLALYGQEGSQTAVAIAYFPNPTDKRVIVIATYGSAIGAERAKPPQAPPDTLAMTEADRQEMGTAAASLAEGFGLSQYVWEAWFLPAETTWDDVYQYYNQQAAQAGWASDVGTEQDVEGGKVAIYGQEGSQTMVLIAYYPNTEMNRVEVLAVFGADLRPANPAPPQNTLEMTPEDKQAAEAVAKTVAEDVAGLEKYTWEAWAVPADVTWDDVYAYYNMQATQAGWASDVGAEVDLPDGGKVALYGEKGSQTVMAITYLVDQQAGVAYVVAVFGQPPAPPAPANTLELSQEDMKSAETYAQTVAQSAGMENYDWNAWALSEETTWEEVRAYYDKQLAAAGWPTENVFETDMQQVNGKLAIYGQKGSQALVIVSFIPDPKANRIIVITVFPAGDQATPK